MKTVMIVWCALAAVVAVCLVVAVVLRMLHLGRRERRDKELARQYLRIVVHLLMSGSGELPIFPRLYCFGGRLVLAETLARLAAATYGVDTAPLRRIVEQTELEAYLLRRARRTGGYRRAWFLALLARLPIGEKSAAEAARYTRDSKRIVRFYALMVQLAGDPAMALRLIGSYGDAFSSFELAEMMAMLRRGVLPVAYEPLIESSNRNLRSFGICIIRQFGVEEAEKSLLRIVAEDPVPEVGRQALFALCALQRPIAHPEVERRLSLMSPDERKALLRHMALEGYSGAALEGLFNREEGPYFEALLNSYKRTIVWS